MQLIFVLLGLLPLAAVAFLPLSRPSSWRLRQTSDSQQQDTAEVCISNDAKSVLNNVLKASVTAVTTMLTAATIASADDPPKKKKKPKILETDLGIPYIVLKEGSGQFPQTGDLVAISYSAFLSNGTMWDSTDVKGRKPVSFIVGKKQVIPGLESVITYMKGTCSLSTPSSPPLTNSLSLSHFYDCDVIHNSPLTHPFLSAGSEVTCSIPAKYAYGDKGVCIANEGCLVPPGEKLNYAVKLKSVGAGY